MEEYGAASASRRNDVDVLMGGDSKRTIAAAHFGGIAIECKIKALVVKYHSISNWGEVSRRKKDPKLGQPISRPGHSLHASIKSMDLLYRKARADPLFLFHLNRVMYPAGATSMDFIDIRYLSNEIEESVFVEWKKSFDYVVSWLEKNEVFQ